MPDVHNQLHNTNLYWMNTCSINLDLHELNTFHDIVLVRSLVKGVASVKHLIEIVHLLEIETHILPN